jgi:L-aspartate oxidase
MTRLYLTSFDTSELSRHYSDFLVLGTGIAGLFTALKAAEHGTVTVLTKKKVADATTDYAQGGIAAAVGLGDSPELHLEDTLRAGHGLCDRAAVAVLVREGLECVMELTALGARFERNESGFSLGREGAHSAGRILHAGDATGAEIERALLFMVSSHPGIRVLEDIFVTDLLTADGTCHGVLGLDGRGGGQKMVFLARATVLATGGACQLYRNTTNPLISTGDGMAAAFRAGATLKDMEFIQFHPTALHHPGSPKFLISEAVRGEGAVLLNARGERFMESRHPRADLAPRDVVAAAIFDEIASQPGDLDHAWLDARCVGDRFPERFPTINRACLRLGVDPRRDLIPVAPAAHYIMGGIATDLDGRTGIGGLFACGETACTGVHGANRLASNSLLEGLVFGRRIARVLGDAGSLPDPATLRRLPHWRFAAAPGAAAGAATTPPGAATGAAAPGRIRRGLQDLAWQRMGIIRDEAGLRQALAEIAGFEAERDCTLETVEDLETANLLTVARLVATAALTRTESRGAHRRSDYPQPDDAGWLRHICLRADATAGRAGGAATGPADATAGRAEPAAGDQEVFVCISNPKR